MADVFFDLDGTLTDPREGITRCIQHAMATLGHDVPPASALSRFIGPSLQTIFSSLLASPDQSAIEHAVAAYRARYAAIGIFENRVVPGIMETLESLSADGNRLSVVSAKPRVYVQQILVYFGMAAFFGHVYGPDLADRRYDKRVLIRSALEGGGCTPARTIMIGDRGDDVVGARSNGVRAIAVTWGYGEPGELEAAKPDWVVSSVEELVPTVRLAHSSETREETGEARRA